MTGLDMREPYFGEVSDDFFDRIDTYADRSLQGACTRLQTIHLIGYDAGAPGFEHSENLTGTHLK